jgi:hypothetical protein
VIEADLEALRHAALWEPNVGLPELSDDEVEQVHHRIDRLASERLEREDAHRDRIRRLAFYLGGEVAAHRTTLDEAQRRLDRVAAERDPESVVPMALVDFDEACAIAHTAFIDGFGDGGVR